MSCSTDRCQGEPVWRVTWPEHEPIPMCNDCAERATRVAARLGHRVDREPAHVAPATAGSAS